MRRHPKRRAFAPRLAVLEQRRLLALTATWLGQDGSDFVGAESSLLSQRPNDYQDIHLRLTGLSLPNTTITRVQVNRYGGGGWTWDATGKQGALFLPDASNPSAGDLFMEPRAADPAGTWYERIRVDYANGTFEETQLNTGTAVDPNLRAPGKELEAVFQGQVGQDWTGPYISVGPDGFQDVRVDLSNLSTGADVSLVRLTATSPTGPTRVWETGANPNGHWNAELLNRPGRNATLGATAELYVSPDVNLAGYSLKLEVIYASRNPDGSLTNRSGKSDVVIVSAGATNPSAAMPTVAEANLPQTKAASLPQDEGFPGYSRAALNLAGLAALPTPQTFASVRSAILSNLHGASWVFARPGSPPPHTGGSNPLTMSYDAATGVFGFPPVRDEEGSTLTLLLTFDDGGQAVARFAGAPADINRRAVDTRVGATVHNVFGADGLLASLQAKAPNIHLKSGAYALNHPLNLDYPVRITADPGVALSFALSNAPGSAWNTATSAIRITSSHVALDGFAIRFEGDSSMWTANNRYIIRATGGGSKVNLSLTHLDIQAPAASSPTYEEAINLMNFEGINSGLIAGNILKGGSIQLGTGPWKVVDNEYRGAVANTITPTFLNVLTSHDLVIRGNHAHAVAPAGITRRFLIFGRSDLGQGIGNLIEDNVIDGGLGTPKVDPTDLFPNSAELILMETYQPRFEGKPSAVSPDGLVVRIPHLRGPAARTGDVVSILTGPHAGEWRMIIQALGPTRYLLDKPLPQGDLIIAIGRGFVDQTFRGNTIDLRGMHPGNAALVINGNHWGARVVGNTFLGGNGLHIHAGSNEYGFETPSVQQHLASWGWSRLPVFDLTIDGNTFVDASIELAVSHGQKNKANSGRTYFTGELSNNRIDWSDPTKPAVTVGVGAFLTSNSNKVIPLDFTRANYPWITFDELRLTATNNWGSNSATGAGPTMRIYAAMLNANEADDRAFTLPTAPIMTAISRGQDGSDFVGSRPGSNKPDGYQDIHIRLAGLHPDKLVDRVVVTGHGGGEWRYNGPHGTDQAVFVRDGTKAGLYIQPYQNEIGRHLLIRVYYADGTTTQAYVSPIFAMARLPVPPIPTAPPAPGAPETPGVPETRVIAINSGGSSTSGAFQPDVHVTGGHYFATTHPIDTSGATNPAPEAVYQSELYGQFTYAIPGLAPGESYTVRLHFAENYYSGEGRRLFNVAINDAAALDQFDIFAAAGGMHRAVIREFAVQADVHGQILINFNGSNPKCNGVEIMAPVDLARGRVTTSSSVEHPIYSPDMAVDGDAATRWSSGQSTQGDDIGWIQVDLGAVFDINRVRLHWETAFAVDYLIQVSDNAIDWTTAASIVDDANGGVIEHANLLARGRYVRVYCTRVNAARNYSLYSFQVFGA